MLVLIPMAIDRFIAVAFPFKYKMLITPNVGFVMVVMSWLPNSILGLNDAIKFFLGSNKVKVDVYEIIWKRRKFCWRRLFEHHT